jgi:hypothetical protein
VGYSARGKARDPVTRIGWYERVPLLIAIAVIVLILTVGAMVISYLTVLRPIEIQERGTVVECRVT